ncbi:F-box only protein 21-like [Pecten maximus]|uniref:F-box only protein 21-like n=1 Tax=Pecten maximus TaxID=6579 RepID=UPI00145856CE|nr:F-box only protein 21-like [Pecten maximus]
MAVTDAELSMSDDLDVNFLDLPHELIDLILQNEILNAKDICNISQTCTVIKDVCQSKELWRRKMQQRWPGLIQRYSRSQLHDWSAEFRKCFVIGQKVRSMVESLSPTYYSCEEVSEEGFEGFVKLLDECNAGEIVLNSLMEIIHDQQSHNNLTKKFYAAKVLRNIQHHYLEKKWSVHLEDQEPCNQWLETGAILLSQWCRPTENIIENNVYDLLDHMTAQVITKCPENISSSFKDGKPEGEWSSEQERTLLETLNGVLFQDYKLRGNTDNYYDEQNSFIHKVLERGLGIPITLAIVYSAVARRLGVTCQLINFPQHLLLKWKEHPMATPNQQFTYIDAFNKGKFLSEESLPNTFGLPGSMFISSKVFSGIDPIEVYRRMCRNLINIGRQQSSIGDGLLGLRNALDLSLILSPEGCRYSSVECPCQPSPGHQPLSDVTYVREDSRTRPFTGFTGELPYQDSRRTRTDVQREEKQRGIQEGYIQTHTGIQELHIQAQFRINFDYINRHMLFRITDFVLKCNNTYFQIIPKKRSDGNNQKMLFSVGQVMCHKKYNYMCVIYGWDQKCEASKEWIHQMGVHTLPNKQHQPFYNVLVEDGSNRYAAQENLTMPESVSTISHPEVGKYFECFTGTHYVMNNEKCREYPEDGTATGQIIHKSDE